MFNINLIFIQSAKKVCQFPFQSFEVFHQIAHNFEYFLQPYGKKRTLAILRWLWFVCFSSALVWKKKKNKEEYFCFRKKHNNNFSNFPPTPSKLLIFCVYVFGMLSCFLNREIIKMFKEKFFLKRVFQIFYSSMWWETIQKY